MDRTSLIKGHLEMCVLAILNKQKSYGYEIMKELDQYHLTLKGVGSIYPILNKLLDQNWVIASREWTDSGKARVYYEINERGRFHLQDSIKEWLALQDDLKSLLYSSMEGAWPE
ncbi:PadR family transcriptional regulator [Paenibacillus lemnae]|uniref:PadR family transcriptional regulator n=1 Tax=Paenibacillus lemnae TaxID=1330551 RepID=A0A848M5Y9_PAELE|nr:PadR family transcriptional regulator [Paenibacillus lemnae]NMO96377.1 PadR family transcriptional regulator [Paenibacillus lemnae]